MQRWKSPSLCHLVRAWELTKSERLIENAERNSARARWHENELRELGRSLDALVAPTVMWLDGEMMRLSGTVAERYATWRELLREIYRLEVQGIND